MLRVVTGLFDGALPPDALCCIRFGHNLTAHADGRVVDVAMTPLEAATDCECWLGQGPASSGTWKGIRYAHDGETLVACLSLPPAQCLDLERTTQFSYMRMDSLIRRLGYPYWLRMWNYFGRINEGSGDAERYRRFNSGRYGAVALHDAVRDNLPAASGVGAYSDDMVLIAVAGRRPAQQIENPRQVSAYCYPRQYGLYAPLFSRAALIPNSHGAQLLMSGTASIVGHESRHAANVAAQLDETLANVQALLAETQRLHPSDPNADALQLESLKVYLRHRADLGVVAAGLRRWASPLSPPLFLQAEICRRELLLEIEGTFQLPQVA